MDSGMSSAAIDPRELIASALRQSTVWIEDAFVAPAVGGWSARLQLSPTIAAARADNQGLRNTSLRAALKEKAVVDLIDGYVAAVNHRLPDSCRIVSREFDLSLEPESDLAPTRVPRNPAAARADGDWPSFSRVHGNS